EGVALGLRQDAEAGVDEDDGEVRGRGPGGHVAGVLLVPGRVGDDERPRGRREIAVGDVDGDLLLPLGPEPVRQQREVDLGAGAEADGVRLQRGEGVVLDRLGIVQEPPDERRLAVVHAAHDRQAEEVPGPGALQEGLDGQKYPSRFLVSIDPSASWSMTRVPRSEVLASVISSTIASRVEADERIAPEQGTQPRLRNRHWIRSTRSPGPGPYRAPGANAPSSTMSCPARTTTSRSLA